MFQFQLADEARGVAFMRVPLIDFRPGNGASFVIVYEIERERESAREMESGKVCECTKRGESQCVV